jgi:hypothetical protein
MVLVPLNFRDLAMLVNDHNSRGVVAHVQSGMSQLLRSDSHHLCRRSQLPYRESNPSFPSHGHRASSATYLDIGQAQVSPVEALRIHPFPYPSPSSRSLRIASDDELRLAYAAIPFPDYSNRFPSASQVAAPLRGGFETACEALKIGLSDVA